MAAQKKTVKLDVGELTDLVKESKKAKKTENPGIKQAEDIYTIYNTVFNDVQREAFILGRISALLDYGNGMSDSLNDAIRRSEDVLEKVRKQIREAETPAVKKPTRRKKVVKEDDNV